MEGNILNNFTYDETIKYDYPEIGFISYFFYSDNENIFEELTGKKVENAIGCELEIVTPKVDIKDVYSKNDAIHGTFASIAATIQVDDGFEDTNWTRILIDEATIKELLMTIPKTCNIEYFDYNGKQYPLREIYFPKVKANIIVGTESFDKVYEVYENKKCPDAQTLIQAIDEQIYCYVEDEKIFLPESELIEYLIENFD